MIFHAHSCNDNLIYSIHTHPGTQPAVVHCFGFLIGLMVPFVGCTAAAVGAGCCNRGKYRQDHQPRPPPLVPSRIPSCLAIPPTSDTRRHSRRIFDRSGTVPTVVIPPGCRSGPPACQSVLPPVDLSTRPIAILDPLVCHPLPPILPSRWLPGSILVLQDAHSAVSTARIAPDFIDH